MSTTTSASIVDLGEMTVRASQVKKIFRYNCICPSPGVPASFEIGAEALWAYCTVMRRDAMRVKELRGLCGPVR